MNKEKTLTKVQEQILDLQKEKEKYEFELEQLKTREENYY